VPVESGAVDLQHLQRVRGEVVVDGATSLDLGEVPHAPQQPVRDTGVPRARLAISSAPPGSPRCRGSRRTAGDLAEVGGVVVLQPVGYPNRSRSGVVNSPVLVVAPISV